MRINHNIAALNTYRQLNSASTAQGKSMEKLSSGLRINKAGDDAAGLAISEKMRGQIRGLDQAARNSQDAISLIQTAEGALNETHSILQRMRELSVQSANDTATADDRIKIQSEVDELAKEITRISNTTEFNTQNLMAGGLDNTFHIGANEGQNINLKVNAMDASTLGVARDVHVANLASSSAGFNTATLDPTSSLSLGAGTLAATDVAVATSASVSGASAPSDFTAAGNLELQIDGVNVSVTLGGDESNLAGVLADINAAANSALGTTGQTYASAGGSGELVLSSLTTGSTSGVKVLASSNDTITTNLNLTEGASNNGKDAGTIDVTFTPASGTASTVNIKANASTIDFGNGLEITKDVSANTAALLDGGGTVGITLSNNTSSAATLNSDGSVSNDAVVAGGINVLNQSSASSAITTIDDAIKSVSEERSKLGAYQNRLEHTINNLGTSSENLTAAESRIRDVDYALAA
jgi:flagellin